MPLLRERLEQPNKQPNSFPASTGQDSCRRAVRIVDIDQKTAFFSKLDLTHPCSQTEFAHTRTKLFSQGVFHPSTMLFML